MEAITVPEMQRKAKCVNWILASAVSSSLYRVVYVNSDRGDAPKHQLFAPKCGSQLLTLFSFVASNRRFSEVVVMLVSTVLKLCSFKLFNKTAIVIEMSL